MSQSRDLQIHISQLEEIRAILNSMKNMAFLELHKLARYHNLQGQAVTNIENAAQDFLNFYEAPDMEEKETQHICILLGTERGFCGDFNESLLKAISDGGYSGIIVIGSRLGNRITDSSFPVLSLMPGASTAEEVPAILNQLINAINGFSEEFGQSGNGAWGIKLSIIYHADLNSPAAQRQILPPFPGQQENRAVGSPPLLNLSASDFYWDLVHHYLFAVLHEIFYISLIAENQSRLQHLEGAVRHLDEETADLHRKLQMYRQEEITEEIEVILLNAENS